jgi:hypothetical protein
LFGNTEPRQPEEDKLAGFFFDNAAVTFGGKTGEELKAEAK